MAPAKHSAYPILDELWPIAAQSGFYADSSLSNNTIRAYRSDLRHFLAWGGDIPCQSEDVIRYLEDNASSLSLRTLKRRVVAISEAHALLGFDSPTHQPRVKKTIQGIARQLGTPAKKARPLLVDSIYELLVHLDGSPSGIRDKAMILVGSALFLRRSELAAIRVRDIKFMPDRALLTIQGSKTDKERAGAMLPIPKIGGSACPYAALKHWLELSGIQDGYLFRRVFKGGNVSKEDKPLSGFSVAEMIKKRCQQAGIEDFGEFSGHSLRRGGITQAYASDVPESDINFVSRHKSLEQLRDYRDANTVMHGDPASASFLQQLSEKLALRETSQN